MHTLIQYIIKVSPKYLHKILIMYIAIQCNKLFFCYNMHVVPACSGMVILIIYGYTQELGP